ncbi:hypothetical protein QJQ45_022763 [Haematococcus lacustris]|nr:hypothetical protein QJQ45_022763 [Haematococcus lacustris]
MWHGAISSQGAIGGVLEHIPDGLDPVLPLGALIVAVLALCPVKFAMGRHGPRRRAALARENAIRAKLSPTELSALETALATPQQLSGDASTCWGHKRPRTCLGRSAQQQLALDQHKLALDQEQLQHAQHKLALDQQQLQHAQHKLALDQEQLQHAQHKLALDQQLLQHAQDQLASALEHQHMDAWMRCDLDLFTAYQHCDLMSFASGSCGPDAPHQARCCHRTCSDCKDKCMELKPGVDGSIMLTVKQYAPVKQKEGPARIELQQFKLSLREVVDKLNEQMPNYIWHHFVAHHQLAVFRRQQQAVQEKGDHGRVVISCDWSERLTVERPTEI